MAVDMFLKLEGIDGESRDDAHKDEIEIMSFSWGVTNAGSFASGGAGKASFQDLSFTSLASKASPTLMLRCASGEHISQAVISVRKAGERSLEYLKLTLSDVLISSYQSGGSSDVEQDPGESISLAFHKIEFDYTAQKDDGSKGDTVHAGWDVGENKQA